MQSTFTGLGSGGRIFTCATGTPSPGGRGALDRAAQLDQRSITPMIRLPGPVCGTFCTAGVTSTTLSPFSTPRRKSLK